MAAVGDNWKTTIVTIGDKVRMPRTLPEETTLGDTQGETRWDTVGDKLGNKLGNKLRDKLGHKLGDQRETGAIGNT